MWIISATRRQAMFCGNPLSEMVTKNGFACTCYSRGGGVVTEAVLEASVGNFSLRS